MEAKPNLLQTAWGAFLLREEIYTGMRDDAKRLQRALILILVVGVVVGVASAWNQLVNWSFSPNLDNIQRIVLDHLAKMPWYQEVSGEPEFVQSFSQGYDITWQIIKATAPSPTSLASIITTPLSFLVMWLIYGLLVHLSARILGGQGGLGQTLGCTALAVAPQLLNLIMIVPYATAAGVGTWTLMCHFMAIRAAHGLTTWKALAATVLPLALAILLASLFACCGMAVAGPALSSIMGGGQ